MTRSHVIRLPARATACRIQANNRSVTIELRQFPKYIQLWPQHLRKASVGDFYFPSVLTCSGRALKFFRRLCVEVSSQILFLLQFTVLKSFSCSLYWEINSRVSSLLHQKSSLGSLNTFTWTRRYLCLQRKQ